MIFSRRLYSAAGSAIFAVYTLSVLMSVAGHLAASATHVALLAVLMALFALVGIVGFRAALRHLSAQVIGLYFGGQILLFTLIFVLENIFSGDGAASGGLVILLILQSAILPWKARLVVFFLPHLIMVAISLVFLPADFVFIRALNALITSGVVLLIAHLIVSEERAHAASNAAHQQLAEYAARVEELATAKERNRLARDIHDNLGHYLTIVNMQIEAALAVMESDPARARQALARAQGLTKEGLTEIRASVAALRANPTESRPLHDAITQLVEEHRAAGLNVRYAVEGDIRPCSAQVELTLYRVAQEGLTNIRKHAQAKRADLCLSYAASNRVTLRVQDDGMGSSAKADTASGFGLLGMRERASLLGGRVDVISTDGQGFTLQVELPA